MQLRHVAAQADWPIGDYDATAEESRSRNRPRAHLRIIPSGFLRDLAAKAAKFRPRN